MALVAVSGITTSRPTVSVTSSASANTLGSFATLGTTSAQTDGFTLFMRTTSTQDRNFLVQLYSNETGSDVALGDPIPFRGVGVAKWLEFRAFVRLPTSTTIKAKCMDATGSGSLYLQLNVIESGSDVPQGAAPGANAWRFIGVASSTSGAIFTQCTGGAVVDTFTSTSVGTAPITANAIGVVTRTSSSANGDIAYRLLDDGVVVFGNHCQRIINGDSTIFCQGPYRLSPSIASSSAMTAEVSCSSNSSPSNELGVAIYVQNLPAFSGSTTVITGDTMNTIAYAAGATSKSVEVVATTLADGTAKTDLAFNTSGLTADYKRGPTGAVTSITLATQTSTGAYSSGGFVHLSNGRYRLDVPDAALASGADYVTFSLGGVSGVRISQVRVDLTGGDPRAATVDADVKKINGTTVVGAGTSGNKWRA